MIAAMAAPLASAVERLGPVPDRMDALAEALARAEQADVIVTTGGASVGDHDLIRPGARGVGRGDRLLARGDEAGQAAASSRAVASSGSSASPAIRYRATSPRSCSCCRCCGGLRAPASACRTS
jgi:hypothetical protein